MSNIGQHIDYYMVQFWIEYGDKRSADYFMVRNGLYGPLATLIGYFILVTQIGPRWMSGRKPFDLKVILLAYNCLMVLLNMWFFSETLRNYRFGLDMFDFEYPRSDDLSKSAMQKVSMCQFYLMSKYLDLLDTIFFVLRRKQSQVTKLHLYHHISVPLLGWIVLRVVPTNGPVIIFALLNTLIHVVMYSYYTLAALGPSLRPYLWWKKYVTLLQIYQFVIYSIFSWLFAYRQRGYPLSLQLLACTQPIIFLILFSQFYIRSYGNKSVVASRSDVSTLIKPLYFIINGRTNKIGRDG